MSSQASHGGLASQSLWGSMPEELGVLFNGLDEVGKCMIIKYLLMETPLTKYDIARALGWGRHTERVDRILRRCQGGGNDGNNPTTAMPEITMTVRELEEVVRECISGNCGRVKELIRMARLREFKTNANISLSPLMLIISGFAVAMLRNYGFPTSEIQRMMPIKWYTLRRLLRLGDVFEFSRISEFRPRSLFDAYWQFTSLVTLRLPFIIKSRFDPINGDVCGAFSDESLCHKYIAGYLIAESWKSIRLSRRFREVRTTHPVTILPLVSIADYLAVKHGIVTKVRIDEKMNETYFEFDVLPNDVRRFAEDAWGDPATALARLSDGEFLAFLSGLIAGDGTVVWSRAGVEVALAGNLRKERALYVEIQDELRRRFRVESSLYERNNINTIELRTKYHDAVKLLRLLPPLIEPLKELKKQVLLRRDMIGVTTAKKIFELLGDGGRNGERGIRRLQSRQAVRFLMVLTNLGLIRLRKVEGFKHHILEIPQIHTGSGGLVNMPGAGAGI